MSKPHIDAIQAGCILLNAMHGQGGMSGEIARQEAEGQAKVVTADRLPVEIDTEGVTHADIAAAWGVIYTQNNDGGLFHQVTLPAGWRVEGTDHSMWSDVIDASGRKRGSIFYKAAFYDQKAYLEVLYRFHVKDVYCGPDEDRMVEIVVWDGAANKAIRSFGEAKQSDFSARKKLSAAACEWLDANYPENDSPFAYWQ